MDDAVYNRRLVGWLMGALFVAGIGLFLVPFAFPTPPPIVRGFQATLLFSPNGDGQRETARISFRMNEPGTASVSITDPADRGGAVRKVLAEGPRAAGIVGFDWDGRDQAGKVVADGRYVVTLRARAGKKQFNSSRAVELDATGPALGPVTATSAVLAPRGEGQCRVAATAIDRGTLALEAALAPGTEPPVARQDTTAVSAGQSVLWNWDGRKADGGPATPGLYVIAATLTDRARNATRKVVTCWVGQGTGTVLPARPKLGDVVRVQLRNAAGEALPPGAPVTLEIARRVADPGGTGFTVVGKRVGGTARGPVGSARLTLPRKIAPRTLWIVATTPNMRVLIPLRP